MNPSVFIETFLKSRPNFGAYKYPFRNKTRNVALRISKRRVLSLPGIERANKCLLTTEFLLILPKLKFIYSKLQTVLLHL